MKINVTFEDVTPQELSSILAGLPGTTTLIKAGDVAAILEQEEDEKGEVSNAQVDKNGLPWDERIHSGNHKMTGKGEWVKKRGVQERLIEEVEAELRAKGFVQQPQAVAAPAPVQFGVVQQQPAAPVQHQFLPPGSPESQPPVMQPVAPVVQHQMPPVAVPQQPQAVAAPAPVATQSFETLCAIISAQMGSALIDGNYVPSVMQRINAAFGSAAGSLTDIMGNQQMIDYAFACMRTDGKIA